MESDAFKDAVRYANRKAEERAARSNIAKQVDEVIDLLKDAPEPVLQRVEAALRGRLRYGYW
jgi:hypothetical protein